MVYGQLLSPFPRLVMEGSVLLAVFSVMLLFVAGQKSFYLDLLRGLTKRSSVEVCTPMPSQIASPTLEDQSELLSDIRALDIARLAQ